MTKFLIVNADDFGYTDGVNRGIFDAHHHGVVTSTSLMVDSRSSVEAAKLAMKCPRLSVGLHFVATNEEGALFDLSNARIVRGQLDRQYQSFCDLTGHLPTHLDSHHHAHLRVDTLRPLVSMWAEEHALVLRNTGRVRFNGAFYGHSFDDQWQPHSAPELISVENLQRILRELPSGITELACHPGYFTSDLVSYGLERELELATLVNPALPALIRGLEIELINFAEVPSCLEFDNGSRI
jgi:predicted glycoside hydrolase/deacetylase ChbG (UPF0249 family)